MAKTNLLFAQTPFQMKVALALLDEIGLDTFNWIGVITLPQTLPKQFSVYYDKLRSVIPCIDVAISMFDLEALNHTVYNVLPEATHVTSASLDSPLLLSYLERVGDSVCLSTYDDGTASFLRTGIYNIKLPDFEHKAEMFPNWSTSRVLKHSKLHYSVLEPGVKNHLIGDSSISSATMHYLNRSKLCDVQSTPTKELKPVIKVFIGQALQASGFDSRTYTEMVCLKWGIDMYLPHPRNPLVLRNTPVGDTGGLLSEDYIVSLLNEYEHVEVYHFYSTTAILLHGLSDRITVTGIMVPSKLVSSFQQELKEYGLKFKPLPVRIN